MQELRRRSRLLFTGTRQKLCSVIRKPNVKPIEPQWYCEVIPTPKHYTFYATGKIWKTRRAGVHYFGVRPFRGTSDPVLQKGISLRETLRPLLLKAQSREGNQKLLDSLIQLPPTHVLRLGWRSLKTNENHDILFIPLRFKYPGLADDKIAWECAIDFSERLSNTECVQLLCPEQKALRNAQMVWMAYLFYRFRGVTVDRFL